MLYEHNVDVYELFATVYEYNINLVPVYACLYNLESFINRMMHYEHHIDSGGIFNWLSRAKLLQYELLMKVNELRATYEKLGANFDLTYIGNLLKFMSDTTI